MKTAHPPTASSSSSLRIRRFETPYLVIYLDVVRDRYLRLRKALARPDIYFAVKANPEPVILRTLADLGSRFDVASIGEIDRCLDVGIDPSALSFGNTIKREHDIARAVERGVSTFAVDSDNELTKVLRQTMSSTALVRLSTEPREAEWPLSKKFGCPQREAVAAAVARGRQRRRRRGLLSRGLAAA